MRYHHGPSLPLVIPELPEYSLRVVSCYPLPNSSLDGRRVGDNIASSDSTWLEHSVFGDKSISLFESQNVFRMSILRAVVWPEAKFGLFIDYFIKGFTLVAWNFSISITKVYVCMSTSSSSLNDPFESFPL